MTRRLHAFAALFLLCGCGVSRRLPSELQRYDKMRRDLGWITAASQHVANDAQSLEHTMARGNVRGIRRAAAELKRDARRFSQRAGAAGNTIRRLAAGAPAGPVRLYLIRVSDVLSWQWVEGVALTFVADQAWADPLSLRGNSTWRLAARVQWAQKSARRAVRASAAARAIRRRAAAQFRYSFATPVT